nr:hypothetical protein CFP56_51916 [Quercus suber]
MEILFVLFIVDFGEGYNGCPELRCGEDGPAIRFPFLLKDRQPDQQCGYPGFDLYCSDNNDMIIAFHGKFSDSIYLSPFQFIQMQNIMTIR